MQVYFTYILQATVCSGAFYLLYKLLLEGRIKHNAARGYLIITTVLSAVIPLLRIPVYPGEVITVTAEAISIFEMINIAEYDDAMAAASISFEDIAPYLLILGYGVTALYIFCTMLRQFRRIYGYKKGAYIERMPFYTLVENIAVKSPFSFFKNIFLSPEYTGEDRKQIITHEASHVKHRHSADLVFMEILKSVLWFNPFIWLSRRSLTEVHEYQADSEVIEQGYDTVEYKTLIFRQVFGCNPDMASSLSSPLIKKRYTMMLKNKPGRYTFLKTLAIVPAAACLMMFFSFTSKDTVYITAEEAVLSDNIDEPDKKEKSAEVIMLPPKVEATTEIKAVPPPKKEVKTEFKYEEITVEPNKKGKEAEGTHAIPGQSGNKDKEMKFEEIIVVPDKKESETKSEDIIVLPPVYNVVPKEADDKDEKDITKLNIKVRSNEDLDVDSVNKSIEKIKKEIDEIQKLVMANEQNKELLENKQKDLNSAKASLAKAQLEMNELQAKFAKNTVNKALVVIDGKVSGKSYEDLDLEAEKIESLTIIKDGKNTKALIESYGEKAKNGIIYVTTKDAGVSVKKEKAENEPLVIIDGEIIDKELGKAKKTMSAKKITYKKEEGAHLVAKYGEQAKNGVVFITTDDHEISAKKEKTKNNPLVIIDGEVTEYSKFKDMPSDGIESIKVEKGKHVVEKYGDKAENGVLYITSK